MHFYLTIYSAFELFCLQEGKVYTLQFVTHITSMSEIGPFINAFLRKIKGIVFIELPPTIVLSTTCVDFYTLYRILCKIKLYLYYDKIVLRVEIKM